MPLFRSAPSFDRFAPLAFASFGVALAAWIVVFERGVPSVSLLGGVTFVLALVVVAQAMPRGDGATVEVEVLLLPDAVEFGPPEYATALAAGADLVAALPVGEAVVIPPGKMAMVETGVCVALPPGYEAQIRPRSGLAAKYNLTIMNAPGTVDADYRGSIRILLTNHGDEEFTVERGMRIAQMVVARVPRARFARVEKLSATARAEGGFGSTGTGARANVPRQGA